MDYDQKLIDKMTGIVDYIADRFYTKYHIEILEHIKTLKKVGENLGQGITFLPVNSLKLKAALDDAKIFIPDDKATIVGCLASAATEGTGYREVGQGTSKSLHCQISMHQLPCNIHVDNWAFTPLGPDGKRYYNPDAIQHIVDELIWGTYAVEKAYNLWSPLGWTLDRIHPIVPNSRNIQPLFPTSEKRYDLQVGARVDIIKGNNSGIWFEHTRSLRDGEKRNMIYAELPFFKF
jgi:hypothetical protein